MPTLLNWAPSTAIILLFIGGAVTLSLVGVIAG